MIVTTYSLLHLLNLFAAETVASRSCRDLRRSLALLVYRSPKDNGSTGGSKFLQRAPHDRGVLSPPLVDFATTVASRPYGDLRRELLHWAIVLRRITVRLVDRIFCGKPRMFVTQFSLPLVDFSFCGCDRCVATIRGSPALFCTLVHRSPTENGSTGGSNCVVEPRMNACRCVFCGGDCCVTSLRGSLAKVGQLVRRSPTENG